MFEYTRKRIELQCKYILGLDFYNNSQMSVEHINTLRGQRRRLEEEIEEINLTIKCYEKEVENSPSHLKKAILK